MGDPGFKFDFEHSLPAMAAPAAPTDLPPSMRKNYRQVALLLLCSFLLNAHFRKVGRSTRQGGPGRRREPTGADPGNVDVARRCAGIGGGACA